MQPRRERISAAESIQRISGSYENGESGRYTNPKRQREPDAKR